LYEGGIPVTIPTPARYAVHKLIVSERRKDGHTDKIGKDIAQASQLITALSEIQPLELAEAWIEAWERGPSWRESLTEGLLSTDEEVAEHLQGSLKRNARRLKRDIDRVWPAETHA